MPASDARRVDVLASHLRPRSAGVAPAAAAKKQRAAEEMGDRGEAMLRRRRGGGAAVKTLWNADPERADVASVGSMEGKTVFLSGSSRGIGKAIALRMARDGANVVITGKTAEPHETLPGTIFTAAAECEKAGGKALALVMDVRDEDSIRAAVEKTVERFGGIDACVSCASAIFPQPLESMNSRRFDLMMSINTRGTVMVLKACAPHLKKSAAAGRNPQCVVLSPPIDFTRPINATNYMVAKGGMTLAAMFAAVEYGRDGIGFNTLWPPGLVTTSAVNHMFRNDPEKLDQMMRNGRTPACQADAAHALLTSDAKRCTGNQTIDQDVLRRRGKTDFSEYDYMTLGATRDERLSGILRL